MNDLIIYKKKVKLNKKEKIGFEKVIEKGQRVYR